MSLIAALQQAFDTHKAGNYSKAEAGYLDVLRASPEIFDALHLLGLVYQKQGRLFDASAFMRSAIRLQPDNVDALGNFTSILYDLGNFKEAILVGQLALDRDPKCFAAQVNVGNAKSALQDFAGAIIHYRSALQVVPGHAAAMGNLAHALAATGDIDGATKAYQAALLTAPGDAELNVGYASVLLQGGEFGEGFRRYESRWSMRWNAANTQTQVARAWRGDDLTHSSILLRAEQGLGDTLQFCRYIPLVAALAAKVYVEVQAPLLDLMLKNFGHLASFMRQGDALPPTDFECRLLSLPLAFETTVETIPAGDAAYLRAPTQNMASWKCHFRSPPGRRVGFVWNANRAPMPLVAVNSGQRSIPLPAFADLMRVPGIEAVSLQKEVSPTEAAILAEMPSICNVGPKLADFTDTAAVIEQLDLVVTVDTSVAHVAGALGKAVWVLVPAVADWRWLLRRADSPWYANARLFRQAHPGDWSGVLHDVQAALSAWTA